jgi:transposase-like protein
MSKTRGKRYSADLKAKFGFEAIHRNQTIKELASREVCSSITATWKRQPTRTREPACFSHNSLPLASRYWTLYALIVFDEDLNGTLAD